ncbi:MAG: gliding motility-associated C-terminal domain-containing protein [Paludibacteraceae bacterium]|nr:gliding motility-associated C-terminal domain-containing protein [Paludibacteraceae bacterium]
MNSNIFSGLKKLTLLLCVLLFPLGVSAQAVTNPFENAYLSSFGITKACLNEPIAFEVMGVETNPDLKLSYQWFLSSDGVNWTPRGTITVPSNTFLMGNGDLHVKVEAHAKDGAGVVLFTRDFQTKLTQKEDCRLMECHQTTTGEYFGGTDFNLLKGATRVDWHQTPPTGLEEYFTEQGIVFSGIDGDIKSQRELNIPLYIDSVMGVNPNNNFYVKEHVNNDFFTIKFLKTRFQGSRYRFTMRFYMIMPEGVDCKIDEQGKMIARTGHGTQTNDYLQIAIYDDLTNRLIVSEDIFPQLNQNGQNDATKFIFGGYIAQNYRKNKLNIFRFEMTYYGYLPYTGNDLDYYSFNPFFEQFSDCATLAVDYISAEVEGACVTPSIACVDSVTVVNAKGFGHNAVYTWKKYTDVNRTTEMAWEPGELETELDELGQAKTAYIKMLDKGVFYYKLIGVTQERQDDGSYKPRTTEVEFALGGKLCSVSEGPGIKGENICATSYPHVQHYSVVDLSVLDWIREGGDDYGLKWELVSPTGLPSNVTNVNLTVLPGDTSADVRVGENAMLSSSYTPDKPYKLYLTSHMKDRVTGELSNVAESKDSLDVWIYDQPDISRLKFTTKGGDSVICAATASDTILLRNFEDVKGYTWNFTGATMTNDSIIHIDGFDKQALCGMVDGEFPVSLEVVNGKCTAKLDDKFTMHGTDAPIVDCSKLSGDSTYILNKGQLDTTIYLPIPDYKTSCDTNPALMVQIHYKADEEIHSFDSLYVLHNEHLRDLSKTALTLFSGVGEVKFKVVDGCGKADSCTYTLRVKDVDPAIVDCDSLKDYNVKVSAENGCVARPGRDLDIKEPILRDLSFQDTIIMLKGVYSGRSKVMKDGMADPGLDPANYSMNKAMTDDYEVGTTFILWNFVDPAGNPSYCHSRVNVMDSVEMFKCDSLQTIRSIVNRNPYREYRYASAQAQSTVNPDTDYKLAKLLKVPQPDPLYCGNVKLEMWFTGKCVDDNGDSTSYAVDSVITGEELLKHRFPIGLTTIYYQFSSDVFNFDTQKYDTVRCTQEVIISSGGPTFIDCKDTVPPLPTDPHSCSAPSPFTYDNIPTGRVSYFCETKYTYDACSGTPYSYENLGISEALSKDYDTTTYPIRVVRLSNLDSTYTFTDASVKEVCDILITENDSVAVKKVQHRNGQFETVCAEDPIEKMALKVTNTGTLPACVSDSFSRGYHTVIWYFNNGKGDLDSCITHINVVDNTPPGLDSVCKDPEMQVFATECEIPYDNLHLPEGMKAYDACDGWIYPELIAYVKQKDSSIIVYRGDEVRKAKYPTEVHKFVWLFTDKSGNQDSCVTYLDVVDSVSLKLEGCDIYGDTIPFTLPEGECTLDPSRLQDSLTFPRAIDICDNDTIIPIIERRFNGELVKDANGNPIAWDAQPFPLGTTNLKWIFIDKRGIMKDSCEKNVKVRTKLFDCSSLADTVRLELMEKFYATAEEVRLAGLEKPTITIDACHAATIDFSRSDGLGDTADYQIGNTTVYWTFNYVFEEVKTCQQVVKIIDMVPIVLECFEPQKTDYECYGEIDAPITSFEDFLAAGGKISEIKKYKEGSFRYEESEQGLAPCDYTLIRTYFVSDIRGQEVSCDQRYTIKDVTSPTIHTRLDTIKIACDQDSLIEIALKMEDVVIDATDNCSTKDEIEIVKNIQKNQSEDTHDCAYNNYTIWRTWIAKDKCGNESTPLIQVVLVVDSIAPKFVLPENFKDTVLASNIKKCTMTVPPLYTKFKSYVQDECTETDDIDIWQVPAPGIVITEDTEVWIYSADKCGNRDSLKMFARVMKPNNVVSLSASDLTICADKDSSYIDLWSQDARFATGYVLIESGGKIRSIPSTFSYDCYRDSIAPSNIIFSDNKNTYYDMFYREDKVAYEKIRKEKTQLNRHSQSGKYVFVVMDTTTQCADTAYSYLTINEKPRINLVSRDVALCEDDSLNLHDMDSISAVCVEEMGTKITKTGWIVNSADYVPNSPVPYTKKEIPAYYFAENACGRTTSYNSLFTPCDDNLTTMEDSLNAVGGLVTNLNAWRNYEVFRRDSILLIMHERFVRDSLVLTTDPLGITRCYVGDEIVLSINTHHFKPVFYTWYKVLNGFDGELSGYDKYGDLLETLSEGQKDSLLYRDYEELHTTYPFLPADSSQYYVVVGDGVCPAVPSNLYNIDVLSRVPTAFTPYIKDGLNDVFLERRDVVIFDRYGQKVFEGMNGWDGTDYNGRMVDPGVFFYKAVINGVTFRGTIEVVLLDK